MIKEAKFPIIKTVDLAMKPNIIDSRLIKGKEMNFSAGKMDFSKADGKNVTTKIIEKDFTIKNAKYSWSDPSTIVVKHFIIPKGAKYYKSVSSTQYCSDKLIAKD